MHAKLALISITVLVLAPFAVSQAERPATTTTKLDVVYKTTAQGPLNLDLHYPAEPKAAAKFPLVLFTHGGGWVAGDKTIDRGVRLMGSKALNAQGFCVASVDFRLCTAGGNINVRDCVTDSKDALRFLAKNAAEFSLDPDHVFTWGDSAGGHLAQMLLLSPPVETFIVENSGHNWREIGGALQPSLDEIMAKTAAFMKGHLIGRRMKREE